MSWSYNPTIPTAKDQMRLLIGDTDTTDQQLQDEDLAYMAGQRTDVTLAAADACRALASKYARQADTKNLSLSVSASQRKQSYLDMAEALEEKALRASGATMYVGGTSISEKLEHESNADEVQPSFSVGQDDEPGANRSPADPLTTSGS